MNTQILLNSVYGRLLEIIQAPYYYREMLWLIAPLVITTFLIEIYFGRYKQEEIGWNTAFGNSLILLFIGANLIRYLYKSDLLFYINVKSAIVIAVIFIGFLLTSLDFFHLLPKGVAFGFSSALPTNIIAYLAVILIYSDIKIEGVTAIASIAFAVGVIIMLKIVQFFTPEVIEVGE
jgi:hypothetical protein